MTNEFIKILAGEQDGNALDFLVAKAEFGTPRYFKGLLIKPSSAGPVHYIEEYSPSRNVSVGWPILDREDIDVVKCGINTYRANLANDEDGKRLDPTGPTRLVAGLRCHVINKLGKEVLLPKEVFFLGLTPVQVKIFEMIYSPNDSASMNTITKQALVIPETMGTGSFVYLGEALVKSNDSDVKGEIDRLLNASPWCIAPGHGIRRREDVDEDAMTGAEAPRA